MTNTIDAAVRVPSATRWLWPTVVASIALLAAMIAAPWIVPSSDVDEVCDRCGMSHELCTRWFATTVDIWSDDAGSRWVIAQIGPCDHHRPAFEAGNHYGWFGREGSIGCGMGSVISVIARLGLVAPSAARPVLDEYQYALAHRPSDIHDWLRCQYPIGERARVAEAAARRSRRDR